MVMIPKTPQEIRDLVVDLPEWDPHLDEDLNWVRPVSEYGFTQVHRGSRHSAIIASSGVNLRNGKYEVVDIDPNLISYANQPTIRLDALAYYLDRTTLFDPDSWYGTQNPVAIRWLGRYLVLDGTHRVTADRFCGRISKVVLVSQEIHSI